MIEKVTIIEYTSQYMSKLNRKIKNMFLHYDEHCMQQSQNLQQTCFCCDGDQPYVTMRHSLLCHFVSQVSREMGWTIIATNSKRIVVIGTS